MASRRSSSTRSFIGLTVAGATSLAVAATLVAAGSAAATSAPSDFHFQSVTTAGDLAYFSGYQKGAGSELFRTDGTAAGTKLVKDLIPGSRGSLNETAALPEFTTIGSRTVFAGNGVTTGVQLWSTDGTAAGTIQLTGAGTFRSALGALPTELTPMDGRVYFSAISPKNSDVSVLYRTDGTKSGTKQVAGLVGSTTAPYAAGTDPAFLTTVGSKLYFTTSSGSSSSGLELWSTDGATVTRELAAGQLPVGTGYVQSLSSFGGHLLITTSTRLGKKQQLWLYDGSGVPTALSTVTNVATTPVYFDGSAFFLSFPHSDVAPQLSRVTPDAGSGSAGAKPSLITLDFDSFVVQGGRLWFRSTPTGGSPKISIMQTASSAPTLVTSFNSTNLSSDSFESSIALGGKLYFINRGVLLASDGTPGGTTVVKNLGLSTGVSRDLEMAVAGDSIAMTFYDRNGKSALWLSDGTAEGTVKVLPGTPVK